MAEKIFSFAEAVALLPEVRRLTEAAVREVEALQGARSAEPLSEGSLEIVVRWGDALGGKGVLAKGLWLVDFDNGSGYYCWHYPEDRLEYYHPYESGFGGRMRIH